MLDQDQHSLELFEASAAAWNSHDVEKIMRYHAADSVLRIVGVGEFRGEQVAEAISAFFLTWPGLRFDSRRVFARVGVVVNEFTMTARLDVPLSIGGMRLHPTETPLRIGGVDVIVVADGLVQEKTTYLDVLSALRQVGQEPR